TGSRLAAKYMRLHAAKTRACHPERERRISNEEDLSLSSSFASLRMTTGRGYLVFDDSRLEGGAEWPDQRGIRRRASGEIKQARRQVSVSPLGRDVIVILQDRG